MFFFIGLFANENTFLKKYHISHLTTWCSEETDVGTLRVIFFKFKIYKLTQFSSVFFKNNFELANKPEYEPRYASGTLFYYAKSVFGIICQLFSSFGK